MKLNIQLLRYPAAKGAMLVVVAGLFFGFGRVGLADLSFDLPMLLRTTAPIKETVLVYMDDDSHKKLKQPANDNWKRDQHAQLIEQLTSWKAKAIVFDMFFDTPQVGDAKFIEAARRASNAGIPVFVAARWNTLSAKLGGKPFPEFPIPVIATNLQVGLIEASREDNAPMRLHFSAPESTPGMAWLVAQKTVSPPPPRSSEERWLNYYGPAGTVPSVSYYQVISNEVSSMIFSNKVVFVGSGFLTGYTEGKKPDELETPFSRFGHKTAGVEINATSYLNLARGDWLREMPRKLELLIFVLFGLASTVGFAHLKPSRALIALITAAIVVSVISIGLQWKMFVWWPWLVPVFIQLPLAYAFSFYARRKMKPIAQPVPASGLEIASPLGVTLHSAVTKVTPEQPLVSGTPEIPDHTLLRCVGRGAYGEVWLARDVLGQFHAVKIVYRARFASDGPYEREFKGLQNFTPISRLHPGWVHILHVGRNDKAGYFFCIMEVADDETSGQRFDPATYTPKTLSGMVTKQGRLPLVECVEIGIALTSALEHLHKYSLIHRDIKPSNVIFAHGAPKFADIGLVTEFRSESHDVSFLGTEGYIAPEGPGSPSADIYSLGKLLYEIAMGRDRREFPEPPTTLLEKSESPDWTAFMEILYKACAIQPLSRYASASAMLPGLQKIKCGWDKAPVS